MGTTPRLHGMEEEEEEEEARRKEEDEEEGHVDKRMENEVVEENERKEVKEYGRPVGRRSRATRISRSRTPRTRIASACFASTAKEGISESPLLNGSTPTQERRSYIGGGGTPSSLSAISTLGWRQLGDR